MSEIDLVSAVLSGYLDPSIITSPPGECAVSLEFDFSLNSTCQLAFCVHKFLFSPFLYFFAHSCSLASPLKFGLKLLPADSNCKTLSVLDLQITCSGIDL